MGYGYFRHALGLTFAPNYLKAALRPSCPSCVRFACQLRHVAQAFRQSDASSSLPFAGLGLSRPVRLGLKSAFSAVTEATDAQATLIPAIIRGKDVMIKGDTGSGKSFGLVLALLSKYWTPLLDEKRSHPTSLLLVPHRDLAYQFMYWIERIARANGGPRHSLPAQVIVRGQEEPCSHLSRLRESPPSILIGTPQAILDLLREDENALNPSNLGTVIVDEVDYIIDFVPSNASGDRKKKLAAKIKRHPSAGKILLDQIFAPRIRAGGSGVVDSSPQLVVCSATLQTGLRQQLYQNSWFRKGVDSVVKVRSETPAREKNVAVPDVDPEAGVVQHCALVFSEDGSVRDVEAEVEAKEEDSADHQEVQTWTTLQGGDLSDVPASLAEEYGDPPSPFHPVLMEGIASIFATDVPKVALLILPASAPVQRAVHDMRMLGINASGLDLLVTDKGKVHLAGERGRTMEDNPSLLVSTTASTRGIDLPDLSHVFIWGVVDANSYQHASGRVGRFGRGGRVLTVLEERREGGNSDEPSRYLRMIKSIRKLPTKFLL